MKYLKRSSYVSVPVGICRTPAAAARGRKVIFSLGSFFRHWRSISGATRWKRGRRRKAAAAWRRRRRSMLARGGGVGISCRDARGVRRRHRRLLVGEGRLHRFPSCFFGQLEFRINAPFSSTPFPRSFGLSFNRLIDNDANCFIIVFSAKLFKCLCTCRRGHLLSQWVKSEGGFCIKLYATFPSYHAALK